MLAAIVCCVMTTAVFTACTNDDDPEPAPSEPEDLAEYTILYYGLGGEDLDYLVLYSQFYQADPETFKKVNVVVQFKYSSTEHLKKQDEPFDDNICETFGSKTVRWVVDPSKDYTEQCFDTGNIYGDDNADVTNPDSLTSFINWAAEAYPAKKYMLIVNDHGGGYRPDDELPETVSAATRGMLYDDGYPVPGQTEKHFTAKSFHRAVAAADVRMEVIFLYACLMNTLEYQFELQDLCDYVIASTYVMPGNGGALYELPVLFSQPDVPIERILDEFCKAFVTSWELFYVENDYSDDDPVYTDLTVTRTADIPHLGEMLREFTDRLCDTYANGTDAQRKAIDYCTVNAVKVSAESPNYDAVKYVKAIINALPEVYGDDFYNRMKEAFNNCILSQYFSKYLTTLDYMVDYSVLLGAEGSYAYTFWEKDQETGLYKLYREDIHTYNGANNAYKIVPTGEDKNDYQMELWSKLKDWGSTMAFTYEQLAFDRAVGWSRWIRLNQQWPNTFSGAGFEVPLPMPEDDNGD